MVRPVTRLGSERVKSLKLNLYYIQIVIGDLAGALVGAGTGRGDPIGAQCIAWGNFLELQWEEIKALQEGLPHEYTPQVSKDPRDNGDGVVTMVSDGRPLERVAPLVPKTAGLLKAKKEPDKMPFWPSALKADAVKRLPYLDIGGGIMGIVS